MNNPEFIKAFGERLRKIRDDRQISQQELADISGVTKRTIQRIEHAEFSPSLDTIVSIAKSLEIPIVQLLDIEG